MNWSDLSDLKFYGPRPMRYPYTFTAKLAQFPLKFYYKNNWMWGYYPMGLLFSLPVFIYCHLLANSPSNKATWAAIRRKERGECPH